eukprot:754168-Hanusia_phi.AAC.1
MTGHADQRTAQRGFPDDATIPPVAPTHVLVDNTSWNRYPACVPYFTTNGFPDMARGQEEAIRALHYMSQNASTFFWYTMRFLYLLFPALALLFGEPEPLLAPPTACSCQSYAQSSCACLLSLSSSSLPLILSSQGCCGPRRAAEGQEHPCCAPLEVIPWLLIPFRYVGGGTADGNIELTSPAFLTVTGFSRSLAEQPCAEVPGGADSKRCLLHSRRVSSSLTSSRKDRVARRDHRTLEIWAGLGRRTARSRALLTWRHQEVAQDVSRSFELKVTARNHLRTINMATVGKVLLTAACNISPRGVH